MPRPDELAPDAAAAAEALGAALEAGGHDYAFGGAIALGYWGEPRGTVDVDLTLFVPADQPPLCIQLLETIGCEVATPEAVASLREHGFCRARYRGVRVDIFVPIVPFYEAARARRARVRIGEQSIMVWGPEALAVFKMMFFRRKDLADVEQIIRIQAERLDRGWVRAQIEEMYGKWDPRVSTWDELVAEVAQ